MENKKTTITIDNRIFLLGLDYLLREEQKKYETEKMLPIAERLVTELTIEVSDVPVEGYYNETESLRRYFLITRALQEVPAERLIDLKNPNNLQDLLRFANASIFGEPIKGKLVPRCIEPLGNALRDTFPDWNVINISGKAFSFAKDEDEPSLVGIACLTKDSILITAIRETVVLYSIPVITGHYRGEKEYIWEVDDKILEGATKIIHTFNDITSADLPEATQENSVTFYSAYEKNDILYRCVYLGTNDSRTKYYHWAIDVNPGSGEYFVEDFWDTKIWTTEDYRNKKAQKQS